MSQPIIHISGLSYGYNPSDAHQVLKNIHLDIASGKIVVITGPSGSGKTTLLTIMGALRLAGCGDVRVLGCHLTSPQSKLGFLKKAAQNPAAMALRKKIGFIFQNHNLIKSLTAQKNVEMALELDALTAEERAMRSRTILKRLGLEAQCDSYPAQLSGGQRQRVAIARALVRNPALILADEPTASLDFQSSLEVMAFLKEVSSAQGTTTVMITHDQRLMGYADRIIRLEDGVIVTTGGTP